MTPSEQIAGVIAFGGGRITSEPRLRMILYLLDQKGMQSGARWHYSIRHHGPQSPEFEYGLAEALFFCTVKESIEHRSSDGASSKVFTVTEPRTPPKLCALPSERAKSLILQMKDQSATLLELAASAHWFVIHEQNPEWHCSMRRRRKGALAECGRLEAATAFLRDLDLLPATARWPSRIHSSISKKRTSQCLSSLRSCANACS